MRRGQVEALARKLGIRDPQTYLLPELKQAVKARYNKRKQEGR